MEETFDIPVVYQGQERSFPAQLLRRGYLYQFQVVIEDTLVLFESDEEGQYRAVIEAAYLEKSPRVDVNLLEAVAQVLELVTRQEG